MSEHPAKRNFAMPLMLTTLMSAVLIGLYFVSSNWSGKNLARHWQEELNESSDEEVPELISRIAGLDDSGIGVLAATMGSDRDVVSRESEAALIGLLEKWETIESAEASMRLLILSEALSANIDRYGPTAKKFSARTARRILLWPTDGNAIDRNQLIAACQQVLESSAVAAPNDRVLAKMDYVQNRSISRTGQTQFVRSLDSDFNIDPPGDKIVLLLARLPVVTPPIEAADIPSWEAISEGVSTDVDRLRPPSDSIGDDSTTGRTPGRLYGPDEDDPASEIEPGLLHPAAPGTSREIDRDPATDQSTEKSDRYVDPSEIVADQAGFEKFTAADFATVPLAEKVALFRKLHASDAQLVQQAEQRLSGLGYGVVHLELVRSLTDPNAKNRASLVDRLPRLQGIDSEVWLKYLARDTDANVRFQAISLLSTATDPRIKKFLDRLSADERDPRIQRLLRQIFTER